jgi:hypothetical protein
MFRRNQSPLFIELLSLRQSVSFQSFACPPSLLPQPMPVDPL